MCIVAPLLQLRAPDLSRAQPELLQIEHKPLDDFDRCRFLKRTPGRPPELKAGLQGFLQDQPGHR
jgi:hypothetical protein